MSKMLILDNENASLWYYSDTKIVHHQIKRFIYGQSFRELLDQGYELLMKYKAQKWLSDDRKNGPLTSEDKNWATSDWLPRVAEAGWKYWAVILPDQIIGKLNMNKNIEDCAKYGVEAKVFSDPEEGLQWLQTK